MTVSTTPAKAGPFTGNDSASAFAFSFKVFAASDIRVVETLISTGAETDLVLNTNYTVVLNNDQDNNPGGTITYKVGGVTTALPSTKKLTIVGDFDYEQPTDLPDGGAYRASVVENALDRNTMLIKQTQEEVARAVKVSVSSSTDPEQLVADLFAAELNATAAAAAAAVSETNAATSEGNAAVSAGAAAAAAASVLWNDVEFKTFADSPIALTSADSGKLFAIDTTGGNVVVNLPQISTLTLPWTLGVKKTDNSANTITVARAGTDTIDGGVSKNITAPDSGATFIPDTDSTPDEWTTADFGASAGQRKKQQFSAGSDFTAGTTTTLTITETPIPSSKDALTLHFDAAYQQEDTWGYSAVTGVVTFSSAIPIGTLKVEAEWNTPLAIGTPADGTVTPPKLAYPFVAGGALILAGNATDPLEAVPKQQLDAAVAAVLPSQTGNASKVLKTDGTNASWASAVTPSTAVNSTSGTVIDFGSIPSWVNHISVLFNGVSLSGSANALVQLGDSGGVKNSGYVSSSAIARDGAATVALASSAGFVVALASTNTNAVSGVLTLARLSGNVWVSSHSATVSNSSTPVANGVSGGGVVELTGALTTVRLTSTNGTDTYDRGAVNIVYG